MPGLLLLLLISYTPCMDAVPDTVPIWTGLHACMHIMYTNY